MAERLTVNQNVVGSIPTIGVENLSVSGHYWYVAAVCKIAPLSRVVGSIPTLRMMWDGLVA